MPREENDGPKNAIRFKKSKRKKTKLRQAKNSILIKNN
jgi:hypothetical protein